jgi:gluconate 5-dehydrogenase
LAAAGAGVILHGRDPDRLRAAKVPGTVGTLAFDVSDPTATEAAFESIARDHGRLDILVNNAGVIPRKPLLENRRGLGQRHRFQPLRPFPPVA